MVTSHPIQMFIAIFSVTHNRDLQLLLMILEAA